MIQALTYTVPCSCCGRPVRLPFEPRTGKVCDACYLPSAPSQGDLIGAGRMRQRHVSQCENNGGGVEGGLYARALSGNRRRADLEGPAPGPCQPRTGAGGPPDGEGG